jgi:hypothetical protein
MPEQKVKFALDQNFPVLILDVTRFLPEFEVSPIHKIDPRLSELADRRLLIALYQLGWKGLITNNYKMLWVPTEVAALVKTKFIIFAVEGVGDDPLRATGAVLLQLPAVARRIERGKAQVFRVHPRGPQPEDPWKYFCEAAQRRKESSSALYNTVKVTHPTVGRGCGISHSKQQNVASSPERETACPGPRAI